MKDNLFLANIAALVVLFIPIFGLSIGVAGQPTWRGAGLSMFIAGVASTSAAIGAAKQK
jgi:hypothetical protein